MFNAYANTKNKAWEEKRQEKKAAREKLHKFGGLDDRKHQTVKQLSPLTPIYKVCFFPCMPQQREF